MRLIYAARRVSEATGSYDFIYSVTTLFAQLRLYLLRTRSWNTKINVTMSRTIFFRLLAHLSKLCAGISGAGANQRGRGDHYFRPPARDCGARPESAYQIQSGHAADARRRGGWAGDGD